MRKPFNQKRFRLNVLLSILPLFVIGMLVSILLRDYARSNKSLEQVMILRHSQKVFEVMYDNVMSLNSMLRFYPSVSDKLKRALSSPPGELKYSEYKEFTDINDLLFYSTLGNKNIDSIYVYYDNPYGNFISNKQSHMSSIYGYMDSGWIEAYENMSEDVLVWTEVRQANIRSSPTSKTLYTIYYRLLNDVNLPDGGVIVCNLDLAEVSRFWEKTVLELNPDNNANVILMDDKDNLIASHLVDIEDEDAMLEAVSGWDGESYLSIGGNRYMVFVGESDSYLFRYLSLVETSRLFWLANRILQATIAVTLLALAVTVWITVREAKRNYQNLNRLYQIITSAEAGGELPAQLPENDLYNLLFNSVVTTLFEQRLMRLRLSEKKYRILAMSVIALQSQVNPHFLFNTLESMKWKSVSITDGPNELSEMITHMSDIMRYSLEDPTGSVELGRELDMLAQYVEIHKMRVGGEVETFWDISEESRSCWILKFLLQPVLENSIKYGRNSKKGQLLVRIHAYVRDDKLIIKIADNGNGMDREKLQQVRQAIYGAGTEGKHIGLRNVHSRLRVVYGEAYGLRIRGVAGLGTIVKLTLPAWKTQFDVFQASSYWEEKWWLLES